jgi:hypothetical protein
VGAARFASSGAPATHYHIMTAGTPAHTKGAWLQIIAATPFDADGLWFSALAVVSGGPAALIDVGIGAAAAEQVLVPNLYPNIVSEDRDSGYPAYYPVPIPRGARVAIRAQSSGASGSIYAQPLVLTGGLGLPRCHRATALGADLANTRGALVDPGGAANTKGAWTEVSASLPHDVEWLVVMIGNRGVSAGAATGVLDLGVGSAGSEQVVVPDVGWQGELLIVSPRAVSVPCRIPRGARLAARMACSSTTFDPDVVILVFGR